MLYDIKTIIRYDTIYLHIYYAHMGISAVFTGYCSITLITVIFDIPQDFGNKVIPVTVDW